MPCLGMLGRSQVVCFREALCDSLGIVGNSVVDSVRVWETYSALPSEKVTASCNSQCSKPPEAER